MKIGLEGMSRGAALIEKSARGIVEGSQSGDLGLVVKSSIELQSGKRQFEASAKIIKVGDQLQSAVIDLLA